MEKRLKRNALLKIAVLTLILVSFGNVLSYCVGESCPYTYVDCAQCCKAGRFISDACARSCNCTFYNDTAWATQKDFPR